jgi:predicted porin
MKMLKGTALLLAACAALPAQAQEAAPRGSVTVYGLFDAVVRRADNVTAAGGSVYTMEDGLITGTRLGFRGSEDLGGGLRAVFTMESGFDPSTGVSLQGTTTADFGQEAASPRFWGRELYVGLRSSAVGVTLGHQYTTAHQIAARFQPQGNPNNTALSLFSSHHVARQDNVLRVDGQVAGVEWQVMRTVGEQASSTLPNSAWAFGAGYTRPEFALGGYVQHLRNRAGTETRKIVGVGGNVKVLPVLGLFGGYMQRSSEVSPQENKAWTLGANIEVAPVATLSLSYFNDKQDGSAALEGSRKMGWAMLSYRFSRRTDVYVSADRNKVEGGYAKPAFMGTLGTQTAYNLGLRTRF